MKTEMDILHMDEHQRLAWYLANRGTLVAVGTAWIGMIGWELVHGRLPAFLIIMVPVFALLRYALSLLYGSRPLTGAERTRGFTVTRGRSPRSSGNGSSW